MQMCMVNEQLTRAGVGMVCMRACAGVPLSRGSVICAPLHVHSACCDAAARGAAARGGQGVITGAREVCGWQSSVCRMELSLCAG